MLETRKATEADVASLAPRLRPLDVSECRLLFGVEPEVGLLAGLTAPGAATYSVITEDGTVIGMFGVAPSEGDGIVWLMASRDFERMEYAKQLRREFPALVDHLQGDYPLIRNYIFYDNHSTIRLLRAAGFIFFKVDRAGACLEFVRINPCVCH